MKPDKELSRKLKSGQALGRLGEKLARQYLEKLDFRTVATNFRAPIGHRRDGHAVFGEIDIIAWDYSVTPATIVFIEVKTRSEVTLALPESAVNQGKQRRIRRTARVFRRITRLTEVPWRYDVVTIVISPCGRPTITLLSNLFSDQ